MRHTTICATAVAILVLSPPAGMLAQKVQFVPATKAEILEPLQNIPTTDAERATRIRELFAAAGCNGKLLHEQPVEGAEFPNIVCRLHGQGKGTVIVGAHYDRSTMARPIDDWTGASLLPALYQSLHTRRRHHTYIFVAFADHGLALTGSTFFAAHMSSAESHADAMVDLDALGLSPTKVWSSRSDKDLVHDLLTMVYTLKLPASQIDLAGSAVTDAEPFVTREIASITIHSLTQQNLADNATTSFRPDNYYDTYRLLCGYLAYLDEILKPRSSEHARLRMID